MSTSNPSMMSLFRNRCVLAIMSAGLFIQIGIWVRNFAVLLFVMKMTGGDAKAISLISIAEFSPIFIFSFIGGTFADAWRPKRTMIGCDLLSALSVCVILVALLFGSWKVIFLSTFVSAILSQFSQPSAMKLFKAHVPEEQLQASMSLFQTMAALFTVVGPILGIFVYQQWGIYVAIALDCVAFLLSALILTGLPSDKKDKKIDEESSFWQDMKLGFHYVWSNKVLVTLGGCFLAAGLGLGFIHPLAIFIVTERLGLEQSYLQWLFVTNGIAMLIGGGLSMVFSNRIQPYVLAMLSMGMIALGIFVIGSSTVLWLTLLGEFIIGFALPGLHIGISTIILKNSEEAFVGRVNGILTPLFMGSMVITMALSGVLKEQFSLLAIYQVAALFYVIGVLTMLPMLKFREKALI